MLFNACTFAGFGNRTKNKELAPPKQCIFQVEGLLAYIFLHSAITTC
jgi:hypothetical protein